MKKYLVLLVGLVLLIVWLLFAGTNEPQNNQTNENLSVTAFKSMVDQAIRDTTTILLDVRTPNEFREGHIVGAINLNFLSQNFEEQIKSLDKSKTYLLYCRSGNRSGKALKKMKAAGFKKVSHLSGGIKAWKAQNYPLVTE